MSQYVCNVLPKSIANAQPQQPQQQFDEEPLVPPTWNAAEDDEQDDDGPLLPPTLDEMKKREERKRVRGSVATPGLENPLLPPQLSTTNGGDTEPLLPR